ncbi:DUF2341 domain-containing protein [candidate division WWE3 bacterium]|nr:DUF2341 domain-containing protein [candidate division WWE3 bacterium]
MRYQPISRLYNYLKKLTTRRPFIPIINLIIFIAAMVIVSRINHLTASIEPLAPDGSVSGEVVPTFDHGVSPQFLINSGGIVIEPATASSTGTLDTETGQVSARLIQQDGVEVDTKPIIDTSPAGPNEFLVKIPAGSQFTPGKFHLEVELNGRNRHQTLTQDFTWGVLAVNVDKSVYYPNEVVPIGIAVLDDDGTTLCDARLSVVVTAPSGKRTEYTSDNNQVSVSKTCRDKNVTYDPDYLVTHTVDEIGTYGVSVWANTVNGLRSTELSFDVVESAEIVIHRDTMAMRIYPPEYYRAQAKLEVLRDFQGTVTEKVPASFEVSGAVLYRLRPGIEEPELISSVEFTDLPQDKAKLMRWNDVRLSPSDQAWITYTYKMPDVSPEFYLVGPITMTQQAINGDEGGIVQPTLVVSEPRQWQIAADSLTDASATRLWSAGFELNSTTADMEYTANIGTTPSISSGTVRSGTYSLQTNLGSDGTSGIRYAFATADTATRTFFRAYIRVATLPNATTTIMTLRDLAGTDQAGLRMTTGGALQLYNEEDSAQIGSNSSALSTNTWYRLELAADFGTAATGDTRVAARIDGNEFALSTTTNWANGTAAVTIGILTTATANFYWDDLAVNQDAYTGQENWPGAGNIVYLHPDGNGTNTGWTGDYTAVDEVTPNDATDYINCTSTANIEDYTYQDSSAVGLGSNDVIRLVEGWTRIGASATGARTHTLAIFSGAASDSGAATSVNSTTWYTNDDTIPRNAEVTSYDMPGGANVLSITPTDLDGFTTRLTSTDCTPNVRITAVWLLVEYVPAEGGRLYSSGFELQPSPITDEWTVVSGSPTINTTTKRSGAASLRISSLSSGAAQGVGYTFRSSDSNGPYYFRAYVYISTPPSAENTFFAIADLSSTGRVWLSIDNSRVLRLYDEDGQVGSPSSALSASTWYRIEVKVDLTGAGSTDVVESKIDGTTFATSSTRNISTGVAILGAGGNLGVEAQTTGDWYFDDIAINGGWGVTQNSYPGEGSIVHLRPNGNGDATAWTNTYTNIDEIDPDDATTVISSSTLNQIEEAALDNSSTPGIGASDPITLVSVGTRFNISAAAAMAMRVRLKDTSNGPFIESSQLANNSTTWYTNNAITPAKYPITAYTRPMREDAFTASSLDSLQVGVRETVDTTSNIQVTALWALVEYVPQVSITISGYVYEDEATTALSACNGSTTMIALRIGSTTYGPVTCVGGSGSFSIPSVPQPATGVVLHLWIDGTTCNGDATTGSCAGSVIRYSGSGNITDAVLRRYRFIVRHDDAGPITNADIGGWDNEDDADVVQSVAGSNITTENYIKLIVNGGDTYTPGGTITTSPSNNSTLADGDVLISSTATLSVGTNALSVGGDFTNSGTFTKSTGQTTTFTAISANHAIEDGTSNFDSVVFNGSNGGWSFSSAVILDADLTMTAGTLSGSNNITVSGGDVTGNATISLTGGTFAVYSTGNFGGSTDWSFSSITFGDGSATATSTATSSGNITVASVMTISANHTLAAGSKTYSLTGSGSPFVVNGTFTADTSTVSYNNTTSATISGATYYNLQTSPASGSPTYTTGVAAWPYRKTITVNASYVTGSSDLTNFPIVISLTSDTDLAAYAQDSGNDIYFTNSSGTKLDHDIETFDGATGKLIVWVEVDSLHATTDTTLFMYYGNTTVGNQENPSGTWSNSYAAVYYMNENNSGTTIYDYSSPAQNGAKRSATEPTTATGVIGNGLDFDGNNDRITVSDDNSLDLTSQGTMSMWINRDNYVDWDSLITKSSVNDCVGTNYGMEIDSTDDTVLYCIGTASSSQELWSNTALDNLAANYYITATFDGSYMRFYVNGTQDNSAVQTITPSANSDSLLIGEWGGNMDNFDGLIDDVRISSVARSADWISTEYNNVNSLASFYTLSAQTSYGATIVVSNDFTLAGAGNGTVNANTNDSPIDINGNVVIGSGDTLSASDTESFTVAGSWTNSGTFTANGGTITFDAGNSGKTITTNSSSFYNVTFNNASGGWTFQDTVTVSNVLNINAGNLSGGSQTINLTGSGTPFIINGTFTSATSTVSYNNTTSSTITSTTYNHLQFNPASGTPTYTVGTGAVSGWYSSGGTWNDRKSITIDQSLVSGSADLTNFPVLVNLASDSDLAADALDSGYDLLFTSSDGTTKLDHEIQSFNGSTGALVAWVRVPVLDYNDNTTLYMYYGNASASNQENRTGVWNSNYMGIWHLEESGNGNTDEFADSTSNANHGTGRYTGQTPDRTTGEIGYGQVFVPATLDGIEVPDDATLDFTGDITLSAWVKRSTATGTWQTLMTKRSAGGQPNYQLTIDPSGTEGIAFQGGSTYVEGSTTLTSGTWEYIVAVVNDTSNNVTIYKNGSSSSTLSSVSAGSTNSAVLGFGSYLGGELYNGSLDEIRVSNIQRSADWISTEYANQSSPSTFYALGSEQATIAADLKVNGNLTISGVGNATVNANTNDPTIDIDGSVTIGSGDTLQASSLSTLTIGNDLTNNGTFTHNSGTVIFDTAANTSTLLYSAAITFYQLTITTPSKAMQFDNAHQTNITGGFTVNGSACGTTVNLNSDNASQFEINATGTNSISYATIQYSNAIAALTANNSISAGSNTNWTINNGSCSTNTAPSNPSSLVQKKVTGGATLATGDWTNETQIQFEATVTDPDNPDTLSLCVEKDLLGTTFSNTEDLCGSTVGYSGSGVTASVTITGLTDASEYHWQARVKDVGGLYSSWVAYGGNAESARDFGTDTTAPTGGSVYDGTSAGVDADFNNGSLSSLSANWSGFNANASGLLRYEYALGTTVGGTNVVTWTNNSTTASVTVNSLTLQTSQPYYFSVRAVDNAGNTQSPVITADGIFVSPQISFSVSPGSTAFSNLNSANSYTDSKTTTLTTSTNAYNGYIIRAYASDVLRETAGSQTIGMFNGGTYALPDTWLAGDTGFGYTSSDTTIQGSNKFSTGTLYAPFSLTGPGDIVADHTSLITGTSVSNEVFSITYRVTAPATQAAGRYVTNIIYTATPTY